MSRSKRSIYTEREDRAIYILLSREDKRYFIWHCRQSSVDETYRHNIRGRRMFTHDFVNSLDHRPCLFVLEELSQYTIAETYGVVLVWIKILSDAGYTSCNYDTVKENAQELNYKNQNRYLSYIEKIEIDNLLTCERCLKPKYKNLMCPFYEKDKT